MNSNKYKSQRNTINFYLCIGIKINHQLKNKSNLKLWKRNFYARDLVSEPGNVLHPDEYAKRLSLLKKDGLKVNIYDQRKIKKTWDARFARSWSRKRKGIISCNDGMEWSKKQF